MSSFHLQLYPRLKLYSILRKRFKVAKSFVECIPQVGGFVTLSFGNVKNPSNCTLAFRLLSFIEKRKTLADMFIIFCFVICSESTFYIQNRWCHSGFPILMLPLFVFKIQWQLKWGASWRWRIFFSLRF